jgi:dienelactone hydrolase
MLAAYFAHEVAALQGQLPKTREAWDQNKDEYRRQLFDMLGLDPLPERTELHATTTGTAAQEEFTVENVHFQSSPHLYVTGNLYLPKGLKSGERVPAILYVCGHGGVKKNGVSYGNKVHYQHHGAWFARHGYVCLVIDSLQLGEIEALHHGMYREGMWWWPARGYTPAGVEAWNCIRALDYLQSRPEVDPERLGVTGRSGGGAYSWWIAALDERIKAAVPVAGITDLQNHVVDGCIEGHCDCMYINNTYQWDYPQVAALVAPRPLVVSNTDRDSIFPLDGVYRTFVEARNIYRLLGANDDIAFNITSGPHKDTQELRMQAFRWFDHYLQHTDRLIEKPAVNFFEMEQLKVFDKLPEDQINTQIQEVFVPAAAAPSVPADQSAWEAQRDRLKEHLESRVFRAWPKQPGELDLKLVATDSRDNLELQTYEFTSQPEVRLRLYVLKKQGLDKPELTVLNVLDQTAWEELLAALGGKFDKAFANEQLPPASEAAFQGIEQTLTSHNWVFAYLAPRGYGPTLWNQNQTKQTHIRRRFILLGQTHDGMAAYDVRRAIQSLRELPGVGAGQLWLQSERQLTGVTLAASLFEPDITRLDLYDLPTSLRKGPFFMNAERYLTTPQLVALAAEKSRVVLYHGDEDGAAAWAYPRGVVEKLGWDARQLQLRTKPEPDGK